MNIPINLTSTSLLSSIQQPPQDNSRSSLKKSSSTQNELDQIPLNRTYGLKIDPNEHVIHYLDPYTRPKPSKSYIQRSIPDLTSVTKFNQPTTTHSLERTIKDIRINMPESYPSQAQVLSQEQKKVTIQLHDKMSPQRINR